MGIEADAFLNAERCKAPKPYWSSIRHGLPPLTKEGKAQTFTFPNTWCRDVLLGKVDNHDRLIAHGVELRLGTRSELAKVPFGRLLYNVAYELRKKILEDRAERESSGV